MKHNFIGCSGFVYPNWKGKFYPDTLARAKWLSFYSSRFNAVELNASFYRFPTQKSLRTLFEATPGDFRFAVKAHKIITHTMKMKDAREKTAEFMEIVKEGLKEKLGCVLFQLPPSFAYSADNLARVLEATGAAADAVVEFRNASWWHSSVYAELEKSGLTFCNNDYPGMPEEIVPTRPRFYMRFHGKEELYRSEYSLKELKDFVREVPAEAQERYVFFNNTSNLAAIANAFTMKELLG